MCGPSCVITFFVSRTFDRFKHAKWRIVVQAGLVPVSVGLFAAGAFIVARAADKNITAFAITLATAAVALLDAVQSVVDVRGCRCSRLPRFRVTHVPVR